MKKRKTRPRRGYWERIIDALPRLPAPIYRVWTDATGHTHRDYDSEATQAQARQALRRGIFGRG